MAGGPYVRIERKCPPADRNKIADLWLQPMTLQDADRLFPLAPNDPMLQYLFPQQRRAFTATDAAEYFMDQIEGNPNNIVWGVAHQQQILGFASLTLDKLTQQPGYTILLAQQARDRSVGTLATAAVVATAFQEKALHLANDQYGPLTTSMHTLIHPDNEPSWRMCRRMGFVRQADWPRVVGVTGNHLLVHDFAVHADTVLPLCTALDNTVYFADVAREEYRIDIYRDGL